MGRLALLLAAVIALAGCATTPSPDDGGRRFGGLYGGITGGGAAGR